MNDPKIFIIVRVHNLCRQRCLEGQRSSVLQEDGSKGTTSVCVCMVMVCMVVVCVVMVGVVMVGVVCRWE